MENENNSIVPVKPSDNAIVSISNQISLTNKLLANVERDKILNILIQRPILAINLISRYYALSESLIRKYTDTWDWGKLSSNKALPWHETFIDKFKDKWSWTALSSNKALPWSETFFDTYKDKWDWNNLSQNQALPWSETFIDKFKNKWVWWGLSMNDAVPFTEAFMDKYMERWDWTWMGQNKALPWSEAFMDKYKNMWNWDNLSVNKSLPWSEAFMDKYKDMWNWKMLSGNPELPWSEDFLEKYKDKLDWFMLSGNPALPWSEPFFVKYKERWDWGRLSGNPTLPYSETFIDKYKDKWDWGRDSLLNRGGMTRNEGLPWSHAFMDKYKDKWNWDNLWLNQSIWDKVFDPYLNDRMVSEIIEEIIRLQNPIPSITVTDIDGNFYHTVKIGTQWWMVENLKTSRYRDGSSITEIKDDISWSNAGKSKTAAWCYYDNDAQNNATYGKLYNWYAVDDPRGLCPAGWHVPSDEEFQLLVDYLGGREVAGGKMKAMTLWKAPNTGAGNSSGFTALPAGSRFVVGSFTSHAGSGSFWCSKEFNSDGAFCRYLDYDDSSVSLRSTSIKDGGFSVRCVKD